MTNAEVNYNNIRVTIGSSMDCATRVKVLTGAFMQNIVEGAIRHPVCDDDGVRGRRRLTCSQHR